MTWKNVGDKDWFNEDTGEVLLDIRAGVIACEQMYNESENKDTKHDNVMDEARKNPEAVLKRIQAQQGKQEEKE